MVLDNYTYILNKYLKIEKKCMRGPWRFVKAHRAYYFKLSGVYKIISMLQNKDESTHRHLRRL